MDYLKYLKIPYKHRGSTFDGADCFGVLRLFYQNELGINIPEYTGDYTQEWWLASNLILDNYKAYGFYEVVTRQLGDMLLFKNTTITPGHIGIVLDEINFLHMTRQGVGISNHAYGPWARQLYAGYRHKDAT